MDTPKAIGKLAEAKFFFKYLEKEADPKTRNYDESRAFEYFLSAFLNAGVSMVEVLKAYNKDIFNAWYKALTRNQQSFFSSMEGKRGTEFHDKEGHAVKEVVAELISAERVPGLETDFAEAAKMGYWLAVPFPDKRYFKFKKKRVETVDACRQYIQHLESLLDAFEKA